MAPLQQLQPTRELLDNGVYFWMEKYSKGEEPSDSWEMVYYAECTQPIFVMLEINFEGSNNLEIKIPAELEHSKLSSACFQIELGPYEMKRIVQLCPMKTNERSALRIQYQVQESISVFTSPDAIEHWTNLDEKNVAYHIQEFKSSAGVHFPHLQPYERSRFVESLDCYFVDNVFLPVPSSLMPASESSISWRHIEHFLPQNRQRVVLVPGPSPVVENDPIIGQLTYVRKNPVFPSPGLMHAFTILSRHPHLLRKLLPSTATAMNYSIFSARVYWNGLWKEMVIDGFFPCYPQHGPIASAMVTTLENETILWPLVLEKAVAKLFGSYRALQEISVCTFLQIFTGLICVEEKHLTLSALQMALKVGNIVGLHSDETVMVHHHSFIRDKEWRFRLYGQASDHSFEELQDMGQSWLICPVQPSAELSDIRRKVIWKRNTTLESTHLQHPSAQYLVSVYSPTKLILALYPDTGGSSSSMTFALLKVLDDYAFEKIELHRPAESNPNCVVPLAAGEYIIVPWTIEDLPLSQVSSTIEESSQALDLLFQLLDADLDHVISKQDLEEFLVVYEQQNYLSKDLKDSSYEWLMQHYDTNEVKGGLTRQGLKEIYIDKKASIDKDLQHFLGVATNEKYDLSELPRATLTIQAYTDIQVHAIPHDDRVYDMARHTQ